MWSPAEIRTASGFGCGPHQANSRSQRPPHSPRLNGVTDLVAVFHLVFATDEVAVVQRPGAGPGGKAAEQFGKLR